MTAIVGVNCQEGVVIGSDSSATFEAGPGVRTIEHGPVKKLFAVGDRIVYAHTGAVGLGQRFHEVITGMWNDEIPGTEGDVNYSFDSDAHHERTAREISGYAINNFRRTRLGDFTDGNPQSSHLGFGALVGFPASSGFELYEFDTHSFQPEWKNDPWWCSMGSGQSITDPFLALMAESLFPDRRPKLEEGIFLSLWTLRHVIEFNTGGIDGPPRLAVLRQGSPAARLLDEDQISEHQSAVDQAVDHLREFRSKLGGEVTEDTPDAPQRD